MDVTGRPPRYVSAGFFCGAQADAEFLRSWLGLPVWITTPGRAGRAQVLLVNGA
jgi:hypothetical protein